MEIQAKITKEEVSALPPVLFEGRIVLVEDMEALGKAYDRLSKEEVIGFDTETRPSFKKGVSNKVALMQLSTDEVCYLFRLNKIGFAGPLIRLMQSRKVKKIGLSSQDDILMLRKRAQFRPAGFVELQKHVNEYGIEELSLQKIYAILFGKRISKAQRLTNWEAERLTEKQMRYAATDAWCTLRIYRYLKELNQGDLDG